MPPIREHRNRIGIVDAADSAEHTPTHGMVDLVAALAEESWRSTPLARVLGVLGDALQKAVDYDLADAVGQLEYYYADAIRHGARIGYAMSHTLASADSGWARWIADSASWLQDAGCGVAAHQINVDHELRPYIDRVESLAQSGAPPVGHHSDAVSDALTTLAAAVEESLREHERTYHTTPAHDPTSPTLEPETLTRAARTARTESVRKR